MCDARRREWSLLEPVATLQGRPLIRREVLTFVVRRNTREHFGGEGQIAAEMVSVEPWQYGVIAISTVGRTEVGSFLDGLSDTDIKQLHAQLGGLASDEAMTALSPLADAFRNARNAGVRKSLAKIAALVGATDATDLAKLAEDIDCCAADRIVHLIVSR